MNPTDAPRRMPRWPLIPIALPAAVAIWSGWVGLGGLCGFGPVHVLPGINDGLTINTAICLPIGMEAYAAYALAVWLRPVPVPSDARRFAKRSALGALALGLFGQVAFHLLTSRGLVPAPVPVVVLVSCIPVGVVGLAAALVHLMSGAPEEATEEDPEPVRVTEGRPPSEWLDDQILALLPRMSVRSTAQALGISKTRVETAKRRAALAVPVERGRGGASPTPSPAVQDSSRDGTVPRAVPAAQDAPAGELTSDRSAPAGVPSANGKWG